jgi:hypothetical protein
VPGEVSREVTAPTHVAGCYRVEPGYLSGWTDLEAPRGCLQCISASEMPKRGYFIFADVGGGLRGADRAGRCCSAVGLASISVEDPFISKVPGLPGPRFRFCGVVQRHFPSGRVSCAPLSR